MRIVHRLACCCGCLIAALLASLAQGQQTSWTAVQPTAIQATASSDTESRLATLEQEVSRLHAQTTDPAPGTNACDPICAYVSTAGSRGLYAGYEFLFVKPHLKESFEATQFDQLTGTMSLIPFSLDYSLTPRVWLGFETPSGLGARARYWRYDNTAKPQTLVSDPTTMVGAQAVTVCIADTTFMSTGAGETLQTSMGLDVQTLDVEATQSLKIGRLDFLGSAGFRYARSLQDVTDLLISGQGVRALDWDRRFEGFGVSAGAEVHRPLGSTGLAAFGHGQGALLFGQKDLRRVDYGTVPTVVDLDSADEVVGAFELDLGLEWSRKLSIGDFFVRASYEGQLWTEMGAPTLTFLGFEGIGLSLGLSR